jgi:hypothetical protein
MLNGTITQIHFCSQPFEINVTAVLMLSGVTTWLAWPGVSIICTLYTIFKFLNSYIYIGLTLTALKN